MADRLAPGAVVLARLPEHIPPGREQYGPRPVVLVGLPEALGAPRFPTAFVTPLTSDRGQAWAAASPRLYPRIHAGAGGLPRDSVALLDQVRALDVRRLGEYFGTLPADALAPIREGLAWMLAR